MFVKKVRKAPPTIPKTMMQNASNLTTLPMTQILGAINHTRNATRGQNEQSAARMKEKFHMVCIGVVSPLLNCVGCFAQPDSISPSRGVNPQLALLMPDATLYA